jgi:hypothetical protein
VSERASNGRGWVLVVPAPDKTGMTVVLLNKKPVIEKGVPLMDLLDKQPQIQWQAAAYRWN